MPSAVKPPPVGYERGDSVYAHSPHGPLVLKVLASGRDGFTGESEDGRRLKVPHDRYLGHQKRVKHAYTIADEGEDGTLLEDETGTRRFIKGSPPSPPKDKPARDNANRFARVHTQDLKLDGLGSLTKALIPLPPLPALPDGLVLMLKAGGPSANGETGGLALRQITESSGRRSSRWVKTSPDQKKARKRKKPDETTDATKPDKDDKPVGPALHKHGDFVAFRHGDVEGSGVIVGSGADGVTVADAATGREHMIRHEHLLPEHPPPPMSDRPADKKLLKPKGQPATVGDEQQAKAKE